MATALVVGATGLIGRALTARLRAAGWRAIAASRSSAGADSLTWDLAHPVSWPDSAAIDVTYLCAGPSSLAACEADPDGTRRVNVDGVSIVARLAAEAGSRVVLLSTSHVFDGTADVAHAEDPRRPVTAYGAQKAAVEEMVLDLPGSAVLRLSKVFGPRDTRLIEWRARLVHRDPVRAFDDVYVAPIGLDEAVIALESIGRLASTGIFQLSGPRDETYYSIGCALADRLGAERALVQRALASESGIPASFRPKGVRLEQRLPSPIDPPGIAPLIDRLVAPPPVQ